MESLVQFLSDPTVAYLLLTLGALSLLTEIFNPGAILPGVFGAIAFILGCVGLGQLPVSWGGLALLALAAGLFAFELSFTASGILTVAGLIAFVVGSLALYQSPQNSIAASPWAVGFMTLLMAAFFLFVLQQVRRSRRVPVTVGVETLRNAQARTLTRLNPRGRVRLTDGEEWTAEMAGEAGQSVEAGQPVRVVGVEGVILKVQAVEASVAEHWSKPGWEQ